MVRAPSGGGWRAARTLATPVSFQSITASAKEIAGRVRSAAARNKLRGDPMVTSRGVDDQGPTMRLGLGSRPVQKMNLRHPRTGMGEGRGSGESSGGAAAWESGTWDLRGEGAAT